MLPVRLSLVEAAYFSLSVMALIIMTVQSFVAVTAKRTVDADNTDDRVAYLDLHAIS